MASKSIREQVRELPSFGKLMQAMQAEQEASAERRKFCFIHDDRPVVGGYLFPVTSLGLVEINLCAECITLESDEAMGVIREYLTMMERAWESVNSDA